MSGPWWMHTSGQVTQSHIDVGDRRVVVIDPEDAEQVERLYALFFKDMDELTLDNLHSEWARDSQRKSLQAALREFAAPTPPKPEEPQGLGAVVEARDGDRWTRTAPRIADFHWIHEDGERTRPWRHLDAVRVLSEGVTF